MMSEPSHSILHERARQHFWEGVGALSIKTFRGGPVIYRSGDASFRVDERSYLILNEGQPYVIDIDADRPVESFCIFFAPGFANEVYHSLSQGTHRLLDSPAASPGDPLRFFDRTYSHDDILSPVLADLRATYVRHRGDSAWLEEQLHTVMQRLLRVHHRVAAEVAAFPAMRAATRDELYRRLHRARDFAEAHLDQPLTLEQMARVACLSPNYFLRMFRQVFHTTPHQYRTARRIEEARRLLESTELSVTEICFAVGFESLGSFSWLFRREVRVSPQAYRQQKR